MVHTNSEENVLDSFLLCEFWGFNSGQKGHYLLNHLTGLRTSQAIGHQWLNIGKSKPTPIATN